MIKSFFNFLFVVTTIAFFSSFGYTQETTRKEFRYSIKMAPEFFVHKMIWPNEHITFFDNLYYSVQPPWQPQLTKVNEYSNFRAKLNDGTFAKPSNYVQWVALTDEFFSIVKDDLVFQSDVQSKLRKFTQAQDYAAMQAAWLAQLDQLALKCGPYLRTEAQRKALREAIIAVGNGKISYLEVDSKGGFGSTGSISSEPVASVFNEAMNFQYVGEGGLSVTLYTDKELPSDSDVANAENLISLTVLNARYVDNDGTPVFFVGDVIKLAADLPRWNNYYGFSVNYAYDGAVSPFADYYAKVGNSVWSNNALLHGITSTGYGSSTPQKGFGNYNFSQYDNYYGYGNHLIEWRYDQVRLAQQTITGANLYYMAGSLPPATTFTFANVGLSGYPPPGNLFVEKKTKIKVVDWSASAPSPSPSQSLDGILISASLQSTLEASKFEHFIADTDGSVKVPAAYNINLYAKPLNGMMLYYAAFLLPSDVVLDDTWSVGNTGQFSSVDNVTDPKFLSEALLRVSNSAFATKYYGRSYGSVGNSGTVADSGLNYRLIDFRKITFSIPSDLPVALKDKALKVIAVASDGKYWTKREILLQEDVVDLNVKPILPPYQSNAILLDIDRALDFKLTGQSNYTDDQKKYIYDVYSTLDFTYEIDYDWINKIDEGVVRGDDGRIVFLPGIDPNIPVGREWLKDLDINAQALPGWKFLRWEPDAAANTYGITEDTDKLTTRYSLFQPKDALNLKDARLTAIFERSGSEYTALQWQSAQFSPATLLTIDPQATFTASFQNVGTLPLAFPQQFGRLYYQDRIVADNIDLGAVAVNGLGSFIATFPLTAIASSIEAGIYNFQLRAFSGAEPISEAISIPLTLNAPPPQAVLSVTVRGPGQVVIRHGAQDQTDAAVTAIAANTAASVSTNLGGKFTLLFQPEETAYYVGTSGDRPQAGDTSAQVVFAHEIIMDANVAVTVDFATKPIALNVLVNGPGLVDVQRDNEVIPITNNFATISTSVGGKLTLIFKPDESAYYVSTTGDLPLSGDTPDLAVRKQEITLNAETNLTVNFASKLEQQALISPSVNIYRRDKVPSQMVLAHRNLSVSPAAWSEVDTWTDTNPYEYKVLVQSLNSNENLLAKTGADATAQTVTLSPFETTATGATDVQVIYKANVVYKQGAASAQVTITPPPVVVKYNGIEWTGATVSPNPAIAGSAASGIFTAMFINRGNKPMQAETHFVDVMQKTGSWTAPDGAELPQLSSLAGGGRVSLGDVLPGGTGRVQFSLPTPTTAQTLVVYLRPIEVEVATNRAIDYFDNTQEIPWTIDPGLPPAFPQVSWQNLAYNRADVKADSTGTVTLTGEFKNTGQKPFVSGQHFAYLDVGANRITSAGQPLTIDLGGVAVGATKAFSLVLSLGDLRAQGVLYAPGMTVTLAPYEGTTPFAFQGTVTLPVGSSTYTLTVAKVGPGDISLAGAQSITTAADGTLVAIYAADADATLTVTPLVNPKAYFARLSGDLEVTGDNLLTTTRTVEITARRSLSMTATFAAKTTPAVTLTPATQTVTLATAPANFTYTFSYAGVNAAAYGEDWTINAAGPFGYALNQQALNGTNSFAVTPKATAPEFTLAPAATLTEGTTRFTVQFGENNLYLAAEAAATLTVGDTPPPDFTVTVFKVGPGGVSLSGYKSITNNPDGSLVAIYQAGTTDATLSVSLDTATAYFAGLSGGVTLAGDTLTTTAPRTYDLDELAQGGNLTLTATFAAKTLPVVSLTPPSITVEKANAPTTYTYVFSYAGVNPAAWTLNGAGPFSYTLAQTTQSGANTFAVSAASGPNLTLAPTRTLAEGKTTFTVNFPPNNLYLAAQAAATLEITNTPPQFYRVTVYTSGAGVANLLGYEQVERAADGSLVGTYSLNKDAILSVTPAEGAYFASLTGDHTATGDTLTTLAPRTINLVERKDITVTANFGNKTAPTVTLTPAAQEVTLGAVPANFGYVFTYAGVPPATYGQTWTLNGAGGPFSYTFAQAAVSGSNTFAVSATGANLTLTPTGPLAVGSTRFTVGFAANNLFLAAEAVANLAIAPEPPQPYTVTVFKSGPGGVSLIDAQSTVYASDGSLVGTYLPDTFAKLALDPAPDAYFVGLTGGHSYPGDTLTTLAPRTISFPEKKDVTVTATFTAKTLPVVSLTPALQEVELIPAPTQFDYAFTYGGVAPSLWAPSFLKTGPFGYELEQQRLSGNTAFAVSVAAAGGPSFALVPTAGTLGEGSHRFTVRFAGNNLYLAANVSAELIVQDTPVPIDLTVVAYPEEGGTVTGSGRYSIKRSLGSQALPISATANMGYDFIGWAVESGDGQVKVAQTGGTDYWTGLLPTPVNTVVAQFQKQEVVETASVQIDGLQAEPNSMAVNSGHTTVLLTGTFTNIGTKTLQAPDAVLITCPQVNNGAVLATVQFNQLQPGQSVSFTATVAVPPRADRKVNDLYVYTLQPYASVMQNGQPVMQKIDYATNTSVSITKPLYTVRVTVEGPGTASLGGDLVSGGGEASPARTVEGEFAADTNYRLTANPTGDAYFLGMIGTNAANEGVAGGVGDKANDTGGRDISGAVTESLYFIAKFSDKEEQDISLTPENTRYLYNDAAASSWYLTYENRSIVPPPGEGWNYKKDDFDGNSDYQFTVAVTRDPVELAATQAAHATALAAAQAAAVAAGTPPPVELPSGPVNPDPVSKLTFREDTAILAATEQLQFIRNGLPRIGKDRISVTFKGNYKYRTTSKVAYVELRDVAEKNRIFVNPMMMVLNDKNEAVGVADRQAIAGSAAGSSIVAFTVATGAEESAKRIADQEKSRYLGINAARYVNGSKAGLVQRANKDFKQPDDYEGSDHNPIPLKVGDFKEFNQVVIYLAEVAALGGTAFPESIPQKILVERVNDAGVVQRQTDTMKLRADLAGYEVVDETKPLADK